MIEALSARSPLIITWPITLMIAPIVSTRWPRSKITRRDFQWLRGWPPSP
jgi:hypothetical protein